MKTRFLMILVLGLIVVLLIYFRGFFNKESFVADNVRYFLEPKMVQLIGENEVYLSGSWISNLDEGVFGRNQVNSTYISCDRKLGSCDEMIARVDIREGYPPYLFALRNEYKIVKWREGIIEASLIGLGQVRELKIDTTNQSAFMLVRDNPENLGAILDAETAELKGGSDY